MRKALIQKRKGAGLTQEDAARSLLISVSFYRKIEQGTRNPGLDKAQEIAKLFNATVDEIFFNNTGHCGCQKGNRRIRPTGTELSQSLATGTES